MSSTYIIAGDWGTSTLRLYLIFLSRSEPPRAVDNVQGLGVTMLAERTPEEFRRVIKELTQGWFNKYEIQRIILSGMIGSSVGWIEAPYSECPIDFKKHSEHAISTQVNGIPCSIIGGLCTQNSLGLADVMRGEETQLLGVLSLSSKSDQGVQAPIELVALPGTHNKWALIKDGKIDDFMTGFTGELFAVLSEHTILLDQSAVLDISETDFEKGVMTVKESSVSLVHLLFSVRTRQLVDGKTAKASLAYLLGLVIGADIKGALGSFSVVLDVGINTVTIVGGQSHIETYSRALSCFGVTAKVVNADDAALIAYSKLNEYLESC